MATLPSPRVTFITPLALTFVMIVTLGVTGENLRSDVAAANGNSAVARSSRSADAHPRYGGCPVEKGYVLYSKRCLKLYIIKRDYQTARRRCESDGGHLFYFKSREEDGSALLYLLETMGQALLGISEGFWVGADDIVQEGHFLWNDQTPLLRDSRLWDNRQPDDGGGQEDCVEVFYTSTVVVNDHMCASKKGFVCQADIKTQCDK